MMRFTTESGATYRASDAAFVAMCVVLAPVYVVVRAALWVLRVARRAAGRAA